MTYIHTTTRSHCEEIFGTNSCSHSLTLSVCSCSWKACACVRQTWLASTRRRKTYLMSHSLPTHLSYSLLIKIDLTFSLILSGSQ